MRLTPTWRSFVEGAEDVEPEGCGIDLVELDPVPRPHLVVEREGRMTLGRGTDPPGREAAVAGRVRGAEERLGSVE
jgi:hypothetical protein